LHEKRFVQTMMASIAILVLSSVTVHPQAPRLEIQSNCRAAGTLLRLDGLPEASGVAASRRTPGLFWAHNDSGGPVIFAIDAGGAVKGRVRVTDASVDDWEDIAVGPCAEGSCLYIADTGDNGGEREQITVYRVSEPAPGESATAPARAFHAAYPDGAHDAEALFVAGDDLFIVTKGDPGPVAVYRFPRPLASARRMTLEPAGEPFARDDVKRTDRPTGADVSPDGRWVAVRTTGRVSFYRTTDLTAGRWREAFRTDVSDLGEPRGEGITFASNGEIVLVGESAGRLRGAGSFVRLRCTFE
jgi:hypothetical protein